MKLLYNILSIVLFVLAVVAFHKGDVDNMRFMILIGMLTNILAKLEEAQ